MERGDFYPRDGRLDYRLPYGAICELVQLEVARQEVRAPARPARACVEDRVTCAALTAA